MEALSVLIVEDEPDLLALFQTVLKRSRRIDTILTASGGEAAIRILKQEVPNLVILDLAMPHVSGNDVIRYILSEPRLDKMLVMVVTAVPMRLSNESIPRVAMTLIKPVSPRNLEAGVMQLLTSPHLESLESSTEEASR